MTYALDQVQLDTIHQVMDSDLIAVGVHCVFLTDMAGNVVVVADNGQCAHNVFALAALSAANFGATSEIARLVGEEDFSLLFHKGNKENIHFSRAGENFLVCTIFGNEISLGLVRLKIAEMISKILALVTGKEL